MQAAAGVQGVWKSARENVPWAGQCAGLFLSGLTIVIL